MSESVPERVADLLTSEPLVAHLATSTEDRPHVAPLWYRYEDGVIEIATTGKKLRNMRENPRVALSVQKAESGIPEWTVTLRGRAAIIEDETVTKEHIAEINQKYGANEDAWEENTLVRIKIGSTSYKMY